MLTIHHVDVQFGMMDAINILLAKMDTLLTAIFVFVVTDSHHHLSVKCSILMQIDLIIAKFGIMAAIHSNIQETELKFKLIMNCSIYADILKNKTLLPYVMNWDDNKDPDVICHTNSDCEYGDYCPVYEVESNLDED